MMTPNETALDRHLSSLLEMWKLLDLVARDTDMSIEHARPIIDQVARQLRNEIDMYKIQSSEP